MGSFRRGKAICGNIDIPIIRPTSDGMTHAGEYPIDDLALPDDFSTLELCYRGLCKLPGPDAKRHRIDILCVPWENRRSPPLLHGKMKANVLGYSLNQRGLYAGVVRDPRNRRVNVSAEEIFKILGVPWQEPHERARG
ncbi:hypothetical protein M405DRAFT_853091 [Rhizopogon salebrosus TDB-379]|nr:hypothetical protein M405DRAFT_853091 [Rhizopogon salebrosus TDB-379]